MSRRRGPGRCTGGAGLYGTRPGAENREAVRGGLGVQHRSAVAYKWGLSHNAPCGASHTPSPHLPCVAGDILLLSDCPVSLFHLKNFHAVFKTQLRCPFSRKAS